jgi:hypothetical protein
LPLVSGGTSIASKVPTMTDLSDEQYNALIELAALRIATAKPELVAEALSDITEAAMLLVDRGAVADEMPDNESLKVVIDQVLRRAVELYQQELVPAVRRELGDAMADAIERELQDRLRAVLSKIEHGLATRH